MERDARGRAADAVERRARQRDAAARAQQALTPEAIKAEEERQRVNAALLTGEIVNPGVEQYGIGLVPTEPIEPYVGPHGWPGPGATSLSLEQWIENAQQHDETERRVSPPLVVDENGEFDLSARLAEAVQPVLDKSMDELLWDQEEDEIMPIGVGRAVIQWILVPSDDAENEDGYQLGLQVQVDEQPPGGVVLDITTEMLDRWRAGVGLQKNRVEHKRFAAGIIERAVELAALGTGNNLIFTLEQLMLDAPTETSVGEDDGPFKDAPSEADEVPE